MKTFYCLTLLLSLLVFQIVRSNSTDNQSGKLTEIAKYSPPKVPIVFDRNEGKMRYLAANFWSDFDFSGATSYDTTNIESCYASYISILNQLSIDESTIYIKQLATSLTHSLFYANRFIRLADKYLYHPNSPLRNEDCYLYFIESIISFAKLPFADSVMYCNRLNLLKKNRVGYIACNFAFSLESSKTVSLYEVSSPFVLLLFYDPDCETCRATIKSLSHNEMIDKLQKNSMLKVLSICPDGYSQQWFSFRTNIPPSWINGYDKDVSIRKWQMYDLKAMPTLYLLNGRKEVVVKDGTVDSIVEYLRGIESR